MKLFIPAQVLLKFLVNRIHIKTLQSSKML